MVLSGIVVKLGIIGHLGALSASVKIQQIAAETGDNNGGKYKKHAFKSKANMTKLSQPPRLSWDSFSVICLAKPAWAFGYTPRSTGLFGLAHHCDQPPT